MSLHCDLVIAEEADILSAKDAKSAKNKRSKKFCPALFAPFASFANGCARAFEQDRREVLA